MIKLEIINKDDYIYNLKDEKDNKYDLNLEFLDIAESPKVGDYIYISAQLLNPRYAGYSTSYTFGGLDNKYGREHLSPKDIDVIKVEIDKKEIFLKRLYRIGEKMAISIELKRIKKMYGEKFMHLCRELFPTILEQEGLLTELLTSTFSTNSTTLYEDITQNNQVESFKDLILSKIKTDEKKEDDIEQVEETPYALMEKAGYNLYECTTERQIQEFKKYYAPGEELCTFNGGRLKRCIVFFAVKKDVDKIKRENFENPEREDDYGTSVMSIQFSKKGMCTVSIKNRYNHTLKQNPDATYGNDLNKIIPGLTQSFERLLKERGLSLDSSNVEPLSLPNYVMASDGKFYKYNMEINGVYYCPGNIIIDYEDVIKLESEKQVLIDYFILDKENKTIETYDDTISDPFIVSLQHIEKIEMKKVQKKDKGVREIIIKTKESKQPIIIEIDKDNNIIGYINNELTQIRNFSPFIGFLHFNQSLKNFQAQNLRIVGRNFLAYNNSLEELELPKLLKVNYSIQFTGNVAINIAMSIAMKYGCLGVMQLEDVSDAYDFLACNQTLKSLKLPKSIYSMVIRRKILKYIPNCDVELLDVHQHRTHKRKILRPKPKLVTSKSIAVMDKESEITESEINLGKRMIEKVRNLFYYRSTDQR